MKTENVYNKKVIMFTKKRRNTGLIMIAPGFIESSMSLKLPEEIKNKYFKKIPFYLLIKHFIFLLCYLNRWWVT